MVRRELFEAINSCDFLFVDEIFIDSNEDKNIDGIELLLYAIRNVNIEAVRFLLAKGIDTNVLLKFGETILHTACNIGDRDIIQLIIQNNPVLINQASDYGVVPIHMISKRGNIESLLYLIEAGANVEALDENGESILHYAVISGRISILEYILRYTDIAIDTVDYRGKTALHVACEKGKTDIISYLLEMYANQDIADNQGNTPIFYAVRNGSLTDVKLLIQHSASIYAINNNGESVMDVSLNMFDVELMEYFDTISNDIQFFENKTNSKLQRAVKCNDLMLVKTLINDERVNELDDAMKSSLYYAICLQRLKIVSLLLEFEDIFILKSYLQIANILKNEEMFNLIKRKIES